MWLDMHMHERTFSLDSFLSLQQMVSIARKKGLDGICITDHDSLGLRDHAQAFYEKTGFPIFVGVEYFSLEGDIVAFGLDQLPQGRIHAQDFVDLVKEKGGICFSAHPFRNNNRGLGTYLDQIKGLDGVEVLNGSTSLQANQKAFTYAKRHRLQTIGASDCHIPEKVGCYATYFPEPLTTVAELITAFQKGGLEPGSYVDGKYQITKVSELSQSQSA